MPLYIVELIVCGIAYIGLVYLLVRVLKGQGGSSTTPPKNNDDDGGIFADFPPIDLDLPPGVTLPGGGPSVEKTTKPEELTSV